MVPKPGRNADCHYFYYGFGAHNRTRMHRDPVSDPVNERIGAIIRRGNDRWLCYGDQISGTRSAGCNTALL